MSQWFPWRVGQCKECGCMTGGGEYCYRHAPFMVWPHKDGTYRVDRNGRSHVWLEYLPVHRWRDRVRLLLKGHPPAAEGTGGGE